MATIDVSLYTGFRNRDYYKSGGTYPILSIDTTPSGGGGGAVTFIGLSDTPNDYGTDGWLLRSHNASIGYIDPANLVIGYATQANFALSASTATYATNAGNAGTANYATTANTANLASNATNAYACSGNASTATTAANCSTADAWTNTRDFTIQLTGAITGSDLQYVAGHTDENWTIDTTFDGTQLPIGSAGLSGTDYIILTNGTETERWQISAIPLSYFNNDNGWTSSSGTVTNVSGTGTKNGLTLTGSVSSSGSLTLGGTLAINNGDWSGTDLAVANGGTGLSTFTSNYVHTGDGTNSFSGTEYFTFNETLLHHGSATELGTSAGDYVLQYDGDYDTTSNHVHHGIWSYRDSAGSDWNTARVHDAIWVDSSFTVPHTSTRCWMDRDPNAQDFRWGSTATEYMNLNSSGLNVTGTIGATGVITSDSYVRAATYYASTTSSAVLGTNAAGTCYLRPTSYGSATGEFYVNTSVAHSRTAITSAGEITSYSSDRRLKCNVRPIVNPIDTLNKIDGISYNWNKEATERAGFNPSREEEIGFIAQDLLKVLPEAVAPAPFDVGEDGNSVSGEDYLTVKPEKLIPLLVEAIKELTKEVEELKKKIK